jgi:xanthine dehydrogenase YagS FAD-binding subunit
MLRIGAMTLLADIANNAVVQNKYEALSQAAKSVGTPQLRNIGTLGGNLCQETRCWYYRVANNRFYCFKKGGTLCFAMAGDNRYNAILGGQVCFAVCPSDTAIALSALDATVITNKRNMPIGELYQVLRLVLDEDEVITEIQVPEPEAGTKQVFSKFRLRKAIDFAISSVAVAINSDGGTVSDARIVLGGVAPVPYRAVDAEDAVKGNVINESIAESAGENAVKGAVPLAKNKYIIQITKTLVKRAVLA